jgi:Tfp pilus assembly protein PilF
MITLRKTMPAIKTKKIFELYQKKDYQKAKELTIKALKKDTSNLSLLNILGLIYTNEYNFTKAKQQYKKPLNFTQTLRNFTPT